MWLNRAPDLSIRDKVSIICRCGKVVMVETCGCGTERKNHNAFEEGHEFVPLGCDCQRVKLTPEEELAAEIAATNEATGDGKFGDWKNRDAAVDALVKERDGWARLVSEASGLLKPACRASN